MCFTTCSSSKLEDVGWYSGNAVEWPERMVVAILEEIFGVKSLVKFG